MSQQKLQQDFYLYLLFQYSLSQKIPLIFEYFFYHHFIEHHSLFQVQSRTDNFDHRQTTKNLLSNPQILPRVHRPSSSQTINQPAQYQKDSLLINTSQNLIVDESSYISLNSNHHHDTQQEKHIILLNRRGEKSHSSNELDDNYEDDDENSSEIGNINHQNSQSYINVINQSIDLRESKKGEFFRLRSQAGIISPTSQFKNINNGLKDAMKQGSQVHTMNNKNSQQIQLEHQSFSKVASVANGEKEGNQLENLNAMRPQVQLSQNVKAIGRIHSQSQHTKLINNLNSDNAIISPRVANQQLINRHIFVGQQHHLQASSVSNSRLNIQAPQAFQNESNHATQNLLSHQQQLQMQQQTQHQSKQQQLSNNLASRGNMNIQTGLTVGQNFRQPHPQLGSNGYNNMKPLNKITWDAFSQIAKLSGDVDHEPHTPRSGDKIRGGGFGGKYGNHNATDDIGSMSDCDDLE